MNKSFILSLAFLVSHAAFSQGTGVPPPTPGKGSPLPPGSGMAIPVEFFKNQCMTALGSMANDKLRAQLLKDKAVTSQVQAAASLDQSQLGASCNKLCDDYANVSNKISWAKVSPAYLSEPDHTLQQLYLHTNQPAIPGKAQLDTCLPQQATMNWCPPTGSGVGAGPTRIENPLDKIRVCITAGEAMQAMNFSPADAANNCARPNIVDAAERIKAERQCSTDAAKADAAKAAGQVAVVRSQNVPILLPMVVKKP